MIREPTSQGQIDFLSRFPRFHFALRTSDMGNCHGTYDLLSLHSVLLSCLRRSDTVSCTDSVQLTKSGREQLFHQPNCNPTEFSRLIFVAHSSSDIYISLLSSWTLIPLVTNILTLSASVEYLAILVTLGSIIPR